MSLTLDHVLKKNADRLYARITEDPDIFQRLVNQQPPDYLWIGCSDSRVPANDIVGLIPDELFVYRNVANIVYVPDLNCLSVGEYTVRIFRVRHVIVCGRYGCGGERAAMDCQHHGPTSIKDVSLKNKDAVDLLATKRHVSTGHMNRMSSAKFKPFRTRLWSGPLGCVGRFSICMAGSTAWKTAASKSLKFRSWRFRMWIRLIGMTCNARSHLD
jgi:carbonic anhydrase